MDAHSRRLVAPAVPMLFLHWLAVHGQVEKTQLKAVWAVWAGASMAAADTSATRQETPYGNGNVASEGVQE